MMTTARKSIPCALTIAGSDSGGGAGIQADLKTFHAFGVHGLSAITCITAQNPKCIAAVVPVSTRMVRSQLETVDSFFGPENIKVGMLLTAGIIREVARFLVGKKNAFVVLDPLLISTSGRRILNRTAEKALFEELATHCSLITPNIPEASMILGKSICNQSQMERAAAKLYDLFACPVVLKGGHLTAENNLSDIFFDGQEILVLKSKRISGVTTHGTGCTYASAICAGMANHSNLRRAVKAAHSFVRGSILHSFYAGKGEVLSWHK